MYSKQHLVAVAAMVLCSFAQAFPDLNDTAPHSDDVPTQANIVVIDTGPVLHTLHTQEDVDWFKFLAVENTSYKIEVSNVGEDIDVMFSLYSDPSGEVLKEINDKVEGIEEKITWKAPAEGVYYLKVQDTSLLEPDCRSRMQYTLSVSKLDLPTTHGGLDGYIKDVATNPVVDVKVKTSCSNTSITSADGYYFTYSPNCGMSLLNLTVTADGFRPLSCYVYWPAFSTLRKNIDLHHNGETAATATSFPTDTMVTSIVNNNLKVSLSPEPVSFPIPALRFENCLHYYFAIAYPDGTLYMITRRAGTPSELVPFDGVSLLPWEGSSGIDIIDMPIADLPTGQYTLYMLQMPFNIDNPLANMGMGRLETVTVVR